MANSAGAKLIPRIDTSMAPLLTESADDRLISAIALVLSLPKNSIELFDSFSDLGGDRPSAVALRKTCMSLGLDVRTGDILRCRTLAELQTCITPLVQAAPVSKDSEEDSASPSDVFSSSPRRNSAYSTSSCESSNSVDSPPQVKAPNFEIEQFIQSTPQVRSAAVIRPRAGYLEDKLVAFVTLASGRVSQSSLSSIRLIPQSQMHFAGSQVAAVRLALETSGGAHAVPNSWIVLDEMPSNGEGSVDRRRLQTWIQNINEDMYHQISTLESHELFQEPLTEMERVLQKNVANVLRLPLRQIGMNFSFSQLGGDDISALMLVSACRTESIIVRSEDIQQCPTLGQLASLAYRKDQRSDTWSEESLECFKLSPIQQMYFDTGMGGRIEERMASNASYRFNQSLLLRVKNNSTLEDIHAAISTVVGHHSMLRARFRPGSDGWTQRIVPKVDGSYGFRYHSVSTTEEVMGIVAQTQATINIESGPVFAVDHFRTHDGQQLVYLLAHHLVVDMMSWRVILHDLDELLREGTLFSERSMSFQRWNELQEEYIINNPEQLVMPFQLPSGQYNYWGLDDSRNTYGEVAVASFTLSPALTSILHTACNQVFKTDMSDIYMAALLLSFSQTFHDRQAPVIWNQEHGRESWSQDIDITETVGWFTSLCPVTMPVDMADDFLHVLRKMKDTRRSIPRRGWSYFGSRYFGPEAATRSDEGWPLEIMFTYAGSVQQIEREKGVLEQLTIPGRLRSTEAADIGPDVSRIALFEVSAMVDQGSASIQIVYNRNSKHQEKISEWVQTYEHLLYEAIGRLRYRAQELTLSDVPMLNTSYEGLAKLNTDRLVALGLSSAKDIEDVLPVTALQQEILINQTQDIEICHNHAIYELASPNGVVADQAQICTIWQQIVAKYPALRTVFIDSISEDGLFDQVVLRRCSPDMLFVDAEAGTDPVAVLNTLPPMSPTPYNPRHRVSVCKSHASTFLRLDISHALCDALSLQNIVWDLKRMYNSSKASMKVLDPSHAACIQYISSARQENSLNFWLGRLQNTNPCLFPRLMTLNDTAMRHTNFRTELPMAHIDDFCRSQDVSRSALMQMAWALALRAFTGSNQVCFGYRSSGRDVADAPEGLALSVGAFENTTTCSVGLENHKSIASVLRTLEDDAAACRPHQNVPISEIRHALGLKNGSLFNTCLSYQEEPHDLKSRFSPTRLPMRLSCIQAFNTPDFDVTFSLTLVNGQLVTGVSHRLMNASQAENLTNTFGRAVMSIIGSPADETLGGINLFTDRDYAQLLISDWEVDSGKEPAHACVHALISQQGRRNPDAPAICAWDGGLSYRQVCRLVSRLANFLVQWGVRPGVAVPVILDKNKWAVVSVLAVLKAGGCFVPIDAEDRAHVETFIRQLTPKIVVATDLGWKSLESIAEGVIVVDDTLFEVNFPLQAPLPMAAPDDAACILLSPGSSRGKDAKGIVFHHAALSSAFVTQGRALNLDSNSRVMQLSSFNVDTALIELLSTLVHGGCVCIPSSVETTSDIVGAACRMDVNWSYMTPVLARKMTPAAIPSLKTVCFRTRRLDEDTCAPWMAKTKVLLAYGAPDICPLGISVLEVTKALDLSHVAPPFLGRFWIVNPEDHRNLMPIGALGELVIESPTLAHRFVPGQSLLHLPQDSEFSLEDGKPKTRYFKTGHLVRYMEDGFLDFVSSGRDDIESNGQIVPVTEIEQRLRRCLGQGLDLAVESIISRDAQPSLAAFVELGENLFEGSEDLTRIAITTRERTYIAKKLIETSLGTSMPSHMMPTIFVPVKHLPVTPSLKVNRRKLRKMVGWLSHEQLQALSTVASPDEVRSIGIKPLPLTKVEEQMQSIWASLLGIHPSSIRGNQSFSMLGGQGFLAGQLVIACRKQGLIISLPDVLRGATLTELCQSITMTSDHALEAAEPEPTAPSVGSSTESLLDEHFMHEVIVPKLKVEHEAIEDVAEAAASQLKFLETGLLKGSSSLTYFTFSFTGPVQSKKLEAVCVCLAKIHPILRTAFVSHGRRVYQVALKSFSPEFKRVEVPHWRVSAMTEKIIKRDQTGSFDLEVPMTKFFFIDAGKQSNLVLRLSGAQYDGASISLLLQHLKSIYIAPSCPPRRATYFDFARSVQLAHNSGAKDHWASLLDGAKMTQVVAHSKPPTMSMNVKTISQNVSVMSLANIGISFDTVVKSAWAMTLATLSGSGDVFFGEIVEGRHLRLADGSDISGTLGPVSNAIPVRVQFAETLSSPLELLKYVHSQRVSSIPFENMGWLEIVEKCTKLPYWTRFSTVVEHRHQDAAKEAAVFNIGTIKCKFNTQEPIIRDVYDLHIISTQENSSSGEISLTFCENRIPNLFANETLKALCSNIELLTSVSMLHPLIPSSVDYCDVAAQIPLPQLEMEAKPTNVGATLPKAHRTAIQAAISKVWTKILDPRSLGVPEAQLHNAAFYDLWGSMIAASLLAEALTQELPQLSIPGSHSLAISMEEVMAHPTMAEQFELAARKMRDAKRRTIIEVLSPKSHPSWGRGLKRLSTTVTGEKASHERGLSSASASSTSSVEALKGPNMQQPAPLMDPIAESAIGGSGGLHSENPASPMESEERWRMRLSLAVEHDVRSMESMTTGSSRTEEETEVRRVSAERKEEGGDVVSPLREVTIPTPMRESRLRRKAGSVLHRISLVSPVGFSGPRLGHH